MEVLVVDGISYVKMEGRREYCGCWNLALRQLQGW